MKKIAFFSVLILIVAFFIFKKDEVTHGPGVVAPDQPLQEEVEDDVLFMYKGYTVRALAKFQARARVLSRKNYGSGREAELSPVDLALGWGPMSDEQILEKISISQSNRWYRWHVDDFPIPRREIERNSANMHFIPARREIERVLKDVKKGHLVEFSGYLVKVEAPDRWRWVSSLTRDDTGNHACELVWVEEFYIM